MLFEFNSKEVTEEELHQLIEKSNNYVFSISDGKDKYVFVKNANNKFYQKNGKQHRDDGPAIEWGNGKKEWYKNGKRHREDGPAIERASGTKEYWINGQMVEDSYGIKYQYLNNKLYKKIVPSSANWMKYELNYNDYL